MAPIYWIIVGVIGGFFTGKLMRFHTVNWHGAVDGGIGIVGAIVGAMVCRGFGLSGGGSDWKVVVVAFVSSIVVTFLLNDLARSREEEIEEHIVAEHHPEYAQLEHTFEENFGVNDGVFGEVSNPDETKEVRTR